MDDDPVEIGVELLSRFDGEVGLAEAIDRLESITTDPILTRRILDEADARGVVTREGGALRSHGGDAFGLDRDVVVREGEFTCRRCGAGLSMGHFIQLDAGELGPFGSSCVRRVLGVA